MSYMKKYLLGLGALVGSIGLGIVNVANAQFATSTVTTILDDTLTDAGSILSVNLPTVFVFLLAISGTFMLFRWVRGVLRRPR